MWKLLIVVALVSGGLGGCAPEQKTDAIIPENPLPPPGKDALKTGSPVIRKAPDTEN